MFVRPVRCKASRSNPFRHQFHENMCSDVDLRLCGEEKLFSLKLNIVTSNFIAEVSTYTHTHTQRMQQDVILYLQGSKFYSYKDRPRSFSFNRIYAVNENEDTVVSKIIFPSC